MNQPPSQSFSVSESVVPYVVSAVIAVGGYFFAGYIIQYGLSAPMLPGIFASIALMYFTKKTGFLQAILITAFVLGCSLKFQFDYVENQPLMSGFRVSVLEGFKYIFGKLNFVEIIMHFLGAAFVFIEASPLSFSRIRYSVQEVPVVQEKSSLKRFVIPYIITLISLLIGCALFIWLRTSVGLYGPMIPGILTSIALGSVLKRPDPVRGILLPIVTLLASLYAEFYYILNAPPPSFLTGLQSVTTILSPVDIILHLIGVIFVFIEAKRVSPQFL